MAAETGSRVETEAEVFVTKAAAQITPVSRARKLNTRMRIAKVGNAVRSHCIVSRYSHVQIASSLCRL